MCSGGDTAGVTAGVACTVAAVGGVVTAGVTVGATGTVGGGDLEGRQGGPSSAHVRFGSKAVAVNHLMSTFVSGRRPECLADTFLCGGFLHPSRSNSTSV